LSSASLLNKYTTTDDQPRRTRHIEKIKASVKQLNDLLEDFLSLGKLDEGKVQIGLNEFSLEELVQDTIDEMKGLVKENQQIIYTQSGKEMIVSDKKMVRNVLINLISNAAKFSDKDSSIRLNTSVKKDEAVISVQDEGIGISAEDQEHLFSSFFRGKNALNIQGTGLGLHIVKRYIDLLGGRVDLESELDKGTKVTLSIPIKHP
jgi:signal transduction histidine kinase